MIATEAFGRTGHQSTRTIFGAAAFSRVSQADADRTIELLYRYGVNHIDTAAGYGDSELLLGPWLERNRKDFFLATKTNERGYAEAREQIHRSLERLRVDRIDLIQLHNLVDAGDWERAMSAGGAFEAVLEARDEGLADYIGVTGHGLSVAARHLQSLRRFDFDSVLLPYNFPVMQDARYAAEFEELVALCRERGVAVQTIKAVTRAPWDGREHTRATWYEPLEEQRDIDVAVSWVLGRPGLFLNTVGDIDVLPKVLEAASRVGERPSDEEMRRLVERRSMAPLFP
jgi:aryl-alcohol dehydrogenase-like predicted oxidoreductase